MKRLYWLVFLAGMISLGAASPDIDNGNQPQTSASNAAPDSNSCPRDAYSVAWDSWSASDHPDFPVSYRAKKHAPNSNKVEYIMLCKPDATCGGEK
jgi:hypothetical protein